MRVYKCSFTYHIWNFLKRAEHVNKREFILKFDAALKTVSPVILSSFLKSFQR